MITRVGAGLALLWLALLPFLTASHVRHFGDEAQLWREAMILAPHKPRPVVNLARRAHLDGDQAEAERLYLHALELSRNLARPEGERNTTFAVTSANLALLAMAQGNVHAAKAWIRPVQTRFPRFAQMQPIVALVEGAQ